MTTWVPLLVPETDYLELAEIVARRQAERWSPERSSPERSSPERPPAVFVVAPTAAESAVVGGTALANRALAELRVWNRDDLRRLARGETATTRRWTAAIDHCAAHVGMFVPTDEMARATGMRVEEWRDAQRKLGKHLRAHYPMTRGSWPLACYEDGQVHVGITIAQAALWTAVRAESTWV